jgi:hypothetical protein
MSVLCQVMAILYHANGRSDAANVSEPRVLTE